MPLARPGEGSYRERVVWSKVSFHYQISILGDGRAVWLGSCTGIGSVT